MQVLRHNVQLVLAQLGQEVLGQNQAVHRGIMEGNAVLPAPGGDEAHVELRVVGGQGPVPGEVQEHPQGLLLGGRPHQHLIGDAGEADDLRVQDPLRGHEGVEGAGDLPVFQDHRADLNDDLTLLVQTGGLDVKADDLAGEGLIGLPVDHHPVVHVVEVVGLHPVQELDVFGGVPRVREGLGHPVIGDGDGPVAPGLRPLHHVLVRPQLGPHGGEGVHGGHGGVQMELHPLLRGVVHFHLFLGGHDGHRLQHHVPVKPVHVQPALDQQVHPLPHPVHQGLALVPGEELIHPDGAGVVGHVEGHHPGPPLFQLPVVDSEHVPLDDHHAHVQLQLPDGHRGALDGLAEDGPAVVPLLPFSGGLFLRPWGGLAHLLQGGGPDGLRPGEGVLGRLDLLLGGRAGDRLDRLFRPGGWLLPRLGRLRLGGSICKAVQLYMAEAVALGHCLLRLGDQVWPRAGGPLHRHHSAAGRAVDGSLHDLPAAHGVDELRPLAQGGKHL